jgi:hypothetical protein
MKFNDFYHDTVHQVKFHSLHSSSLSQMRNTHMFCLDLRVQFQLCVIVLLHVAVCTYIS